MATLNVQTAINWARARMGKITYSMVYRDGPNSYDCSSAVYYALNSAGGNFRIGNTDTLFNDLERTGWTKVPRNAQGGYDARAGDIFIWGVRGASGGAFGHTGFFVDPDNIIHCNYGYNGMTINNHDVIWNANGQPPCTIYRYTGGQSTPVSSGGGAVTKFSAPNADAPRWIVEPGDNLTRISNYYFGNASHVAAIAKYNGLANQNAINIGQEIYIPGPLFWDVTQEELNRGLTWESIDDYYGYAHGYTRRRNPGKSLVAGTRLSIWG